MKKTILTILGTLAIAIPATLFVLAYLQLSAFYSKVSQMEQLNNYNFSIISEVIKINNLKMPEQQQANQ